MEERRDSWLRDQPVLAHFLGNLPEAGEVLIAQFDFPGYARAFVALESIAFGISAQRLFHFEPPSAGQAAMGAATLWKDRVGKMSIGRMPL